MTTTPGAERASSNADRITRLLEGVALQRDIQLCINNRSIAYRTEYPGPPGELLWEMIGLTLVEAVNIECSTTPVADHYWTYRRELEANGDLEALGRFHQHVDGIYVYVVSGLRDLSGFQDVSGYRIERDQPGFEEASLAWLTIAGFHAYSLGPSARRQLEADARGSVMMRLREISTALHTSEYFAPSSARFARSSDEYACALELLVDPSSRPLYFTQSDVTNFLRQYNFDSLIRDSNWAALWEDTLSESPDRGSAEQAFADQIFQGQAQAKFSTDLRAIVERSAHTWVNEDGDIDYRRVQSMMDTIVFDLEAARQHLIAQVGIGLALEGQALDGAFLLHEGIRKSESDPLSPYSCFASAIEP